MTVWLPDGYDDGEHLYKCTCLGGAGRRVVGNTAEQRAIVTDTEIHVIFSLFKLEHLYRKYTRLFPGGSRTHRADWETCARICSKLYTYSSLCTAGICSDHFDIFAGQLWSHGAASMPSEEKVEHRLFYVFDKGLCIWIRVWGYIQIIMVKDEHTSVW